MNNTNKAGVFVSKKCARQKAEPNNRGSKPGKYEVKTSGQYILHPIMPSVAIVSCYNYPCILPTNLIYCVKCQLT